MIFLPVIPSLSAYIPKHRFNPFKHNLGWLALSKTLTEHGYDPTKHFLMSDKYQTTSILSFYGPGQKRAYFLNLCKIRNNQFCYWPSLQEEQGGRIGYFVWVENTPYLEHHWQTKYQFYQHQLQNYFEKVEFIDFAPLLYEGTCIVKAALIFKCYNCKNLYPKHSSLY